LLHQVVDEFMDGGTADSKKEKVLPGYRVPTTRPSIKRGQLRQLWMDTYFLCKYGSKSAGSNSSNFLKELSCLECRAALRAVSFDGLEHQPNSSEIELSNAGRSAFFASLGFAEK